MIEFSFPFEIILFFLNIHFELSLVIANNIWFHFQMKTKIRNSGKQPSDYKALLNIKSGWSVTQQLNRQESKKG